MKYLFNVPENKQIDVIIDTDTKNEADDQFAVIYALMSPKLNVKGIVATHFGKDRFENSMEESYKELNKILDYAGFHVPTYKGSKEALMVKDTPSYFGNEIPYDNEGVQFIIESAMKATKPIYIAVMGPLTNVASALLIKPEIASKLIIVWNGGGIYPEGEIEFNLVNDIAAANVVFRSDVTLWQIPTNVYCKPRISLAEMQVKVRPYGKIGRYLFEEVIRFLEEMKDYKNWPPGESLDICDLTTIGLLLEEHKYCYRRVQAPYITENMTYIKRDNNRYIRVYEDIDARYIIEDFFCKLQINYGVVK